MKKTANTTQKMLAELSALSNYYGGNADFVLAGGGNTSIKTDKELYIKGSGTELATVRANDFVGLDRAMVSATLEKSYSKDPYQREEEIKNDLLAARLHPEKGGRPSVETALHNLFQATYVVHLHPWWINSLTCSQDGKKVVAKLLGDSAIWLEYTNPGFTLAKAVEKALANYRRSHGGKDPDYLIIQNHGPFIPAADQADARRKISFLYKKVLHFLNKAPKNPLGPRKVLVDSDREEIQAFCGAALRALLADADSLKTVLFDDSPLVLDFVCTEKGKQCILSGPLTPDQIVYCKSFPLWVPLKKGEQFSKIASRLPVLIKEFRAKRKYDPKVVLIEGLGMFSVGDTAKGAQTIHEIYYDAMKIMRGAYACGKPHFLTPKQYGFIDDWEVEQYRRKVAAAAAGAAGVLQNKVAVVVNADSNAGACLAADMAKQGASVVLAGSDPKMLEAAETGVGACARKGSKSITLKGDTASRLFVSRALSTVSRLYGGADLLVFLEDGTGYADISAQAEEEFSRLCRNNMQGYFSWAKAFSNIMDVQSVFCPAFSGNIVQIARDFDAVGLTLRFSSELADSGIKVNTIMAFDELASANGKSSGKAAKKLLHTFYHLVNDQDHSGVILGVGHTTDHKECCVEAS